MNLSPIMAFSEVKSDLSDGSLPRSVVGCDSWRILREQLNKLKDGFFTLAYFVRELQITRLILISTLQPSTD